MRILITSDWQAEWANLDECRKAWKHCVEIARKEKLEAIVNAGDLKHVYNPVDVRVIKFWQWAISFARKAELRVIIVLGNHDRIGQYDDNQNWLPILRRAGAETFDQPSTVGMRNGTLAILPFSTSITRVKTEAKKLAKCRDWNPKTDVLIFHQDLKNCKYNALGERSEAKFRAEDLYPDRYLACVGGHVHLHQTVGKKNVQYVGSPFAMDWGEANQQKGFTIVSGTAIKRVASIIPGWYDEEWPGFPVDGPEQLFKGAKVRIHVHCPADGSYSRRIESARAAAEKKYVGATVYVVPEFEEEENATARIKIEDSDERKIRAYVEATAGSMSGRTRARVETYIAAKLKSCGVGGRVGHGVRFLRAVGRDFLCYKEIELDFDKKGLTVVQGKNLDWAGRSNGSGKTSCLQPIPVAIFGTTFKGQKYDRWARRGGKGPAEIHVSLKDSSGRKIKVSRGRRPGFLQFFVNGKDRSSGRDSRAKDATQGFIEKKIGFTWQTLANAVYIDPQVTHAFLAGTKKERTEILARFQNLERFEKALALVRQDKSRVQDSLDDSAQGAEVTRARIKDCKEALVKAEKVAKDTTKKARRLWDAAVAALDAAERKWKKKKKILETELANIERKYDRVSQKAAKLEPRVSHLKKRIAQLEDELALAGNLQGEEYKCPTCFQPIDYELIKRHRKKFKSIIREDKVTLANRESEYRRLSNIALGYEADYDNLKLKLADRCKDIEQLQREAEWHGAKYKALVREDSSEKKSVKHYRDKYRSLRQQLEKLKQVREIYEKEMFELGYAEQAFSRDGIPAFLSAQLIPLLNKAAEEYAVMFGDKVVQVRFKIEDGEFEPYVLNASGGESIDDQSVGEKALAGLITSFALREIAPKTNLLILDEPGEGLDAANARQFAQALPKLAERFGSVFITSHNQVILSELSGERTITVVKKNGRSRLVA